MSTTPATEQFEAYRPLMFSIAYRMLGSAMEAEDIVQDAYLRYQAVPPETIHSTKAFLSTIVTRLCLNQLESARVKREEYIGPWLPEPVLTESGIDMTIDATSLSPAQQTELHESIALAFLVLLEQLTPIERAIVLLHDVFDYEYAEISEIIEKDEAACRQILSRAKKHLADHRPRFKSTREQQRQFLDQFMQAVNVGELDGLMKLLSADVTLWADGGGKARGAALEPFHGQAAVAKFVLASTHFITGGFKIEIAEVNGQPAALLRVNDQTTVVLTIEVDRNRINEIRVIGNPDKLKRV